MQNRKSVQKPAQKQVWISRLFSNPVSKKRFLRFYSMKRAWFSLVILVLLYAISLCSELIANSTPLYVQYQGHSCFPVFIYYTEDEFLHNGRMTRPDYKALNRLPAFVDNPKNFMIFPPFPFGPYESADADTMNIPDTVTLEFRPVPRVFSVDIGKDFRIVRFAGTVFFSNIRDPSGLMLDRFFRLSGSFKSAVDRRFENRASPRFTVMKRGPEKNMIAVDIPTFRPRSRNPKTIRLILRETASGQSPASIVSMKFGRDLASVKKPPALWNRLSPGEKTIISELVASRFKKPVNDYQSVISGVQYRLSFKKAGISFPFHPISGHLFGLDAAGRDVFARILYGLRISMTFGFLLVFASMGLGTAAGAIQGYYGGRIDITAQRLTEIWSAIPFLYVMILMGSIYGRSFALLLFCYGLFNWIGISYYIRAEFLKLRKKPFVEAAKCMGVPGRRIIFRHILPNALVPVITFFPFSLVGAIGALAALDYLGFGLPPPTPSWGELLFEAQQYRWAWWLIFYPAMALFIVMLLGVFVGEGVRNAFDPRQYSRLN